MYTYKFTVHDVNEPHRSMGRPTRYVLDVVDVDDVDEPAAAIQLFNADEHRRVRRPSSALRRQRLREVT